jgi:hypothetical protein
MLSSQENKVVHPLAVPMEDTVVKEEERRSQVTTNFDATLEFQTSYVTLEADVGGQLLPKKEI